MHPATLTPEAKRDSLLQTSRFLDALCKGLSLNQSREGKSPAIDYSSRRRMRTPWHTRVAIFAELFANGHTLATMLMQLAVRETGISPDRPGTGLLAFITNDIAFRLANADRPKALAHLTDKHLFTDEWLVTTGTRQTCLLGGRAVHSAV